MRKHDIQMQTDSTSVPTSDSDEDGVLVWEKKKKAFEVDVFTVAPRQTSFSITRGEFERDIFCWV